MEKAKIRGITPLPEIRMGITEDCPPYIFLPLICFAYCTGTFLSERSTYTTAKNTTAHTITNATSCQMASLLLGISTILAMIACPAVARIPTKMIMDCPLPTP